MRYDRFRQRHRTRKLALFVLRLPHRVVGNGQR
jgi:hypothetical protein